MAELDATVIRQMRAMARNGEGPSRVLREVIARLSPDIPHKVTLINYMREAFCLSLQQAGPVAGWAGAGAGDLTDAQFDALIAPEIHKNRRTWESAEAA